MNTTIDLEKEIIRRNSAVLETEQTALNEQAKLDAEVDKVLQGASERYESDLLGELGFDYKLATAQGILKEREASAKLPKERVMDADAIKAICIEYGLRFLPTRFYKGALDSGIGPALEALRTNMGGKLPVTNEPELCKDAKDEKAKDRPQFYIAAPEESFVLKPIPKDPLLFCRLSAKKFFLVHKWGTDLDREEAEARKGKTTESNWNSQQKETNLSSFVNQFLVTEPWDSNPLRGMMERDVEREIRRRAYSW